MATLFFQRIRYYSLFTLTIAGAILLACFFFTHLILKDGCTDGAKFFVYWMSVLFILSIIGICFYHERPRENKTIETFENKLDNLFGLSWTGAFFSVLSFIVVGFFLIIILGNAEVHTWPTWARAVEGSFISITGVSAVLMFIISIIHIFVGDYD
jgi:hypothetical protein